MEKKRRKRKLKRGKRMATAIGDLPAICNPEFRGLFRCR